MFKLISLIVFGLVRRVYGEFTPKAELDLQNELYLDLGLDREQAKKKNRFYLRGEIWKTVQ